MAGTGKAWGTVGGGLVAIALLAVACGDKAVTTTAPPGATSSDQLTSTTTSIAPAEDSAQSEPAGTAMIAFASNRDHEGPLEDFATANMEIYTMAADGTGIARITHDPRVDFYPRWSPTGTEIAFTSNRDSGTESMDLYVITLATEQVRRSRPLAECSATSGPRMAAPSRTHTR